MSSSCPLSASRACQAKYFTRDRLLKYGFGSLRLLLIVILAFTWEASIAPVQPSSLQSSLSQYLSSYRWILHIDIGAIGAIINTQQFSYNIHMLLLIQAGILLLYDIYLFDYTMVIYLLKTFGGDYLSGKIDTFEWKWVLAYTFGMILPYSLVTIPQVEILSYIRILVFMFTVQFICEYGDNHWETWTLFRHRYSFEILTITLLIVTPSLQNYEFRCIQYDLVICLSYRLSNFAICVLNSNFISRYFLKCLFTVTGRYLQLNIQIVDDPEIASLVLKHSSCKGYGIEQYIATPAWSPLLSFESVDGELWMNMRVNFDSIMKLLPDASSLQEIAQECVAALVDRHVKESIIIDAHAIAQVTAEIFGVYVFGKDVLQKQKELDALVKASWEWRKEISVRGKANMKTKLEAIRVMLDELLPLNEELNKLFGNLWEQPEYYSLLLQPFFISPIINTGDIMCAFQSNPGLSLDQLLKIMHPFPIFERYIASDLAINKKIVVRANTQVLMFSSDFQDSNWPVFGSGLRSCAGMNLALTYLKIMTRFFSVVEPRLFQPQRGHKYSGRHLDGKSGSISEWVEETLYFTHIVWKILISATPKIPFNNNAPTKA